MAVFGHVMVGHGKAKDHFHAERMSVEVGRFLIGGRDRRGIGRFRLRGRHIGRSGRGRHSITAMKAKNVL